MFIHIFARAPEPAQRTHTYACIHTPRHVYVLLNQHNASVVHSIFQSWRLHTCIRPCVEATVAGAYITRIDSFLNEHAKARTYVGRDSDLERHASVYFHPAAARNSSYDNHKHGHDRGGAFNSRRSPNRSGLKNSNSNSNSKEVRGGEGAVPDMQHAHPHPHNHDHHKDNVWRIVLSSQSRRPVPSSVRLTGGYLNSNQGPSGYMTGGYLVSSPGYIPPVVPGSGRRSPPPHRDALTSSSPSPQKGISRHTAAGAGTPQRSHTFAASTPQRDIYLTSRMAHDAMSGSPQTAASASFYTQR
jgi:hypothetical protein